MEGDWLDGHLELCAFVESLCTLARACWTQGGLNSLRSYWLAFVDADAVSIRWAVPSGGNRLKEKMRPVPAGSFDSAVEDAKYRLAGEADEHTFRSWSALGAVYALPIAGLMCVVAAFQAKADRPRM